MGSAMFAASNSVTVTLPHAVTVGSTTLPSGQYTMSPIEMVDGNEYFVVRGGKTPAVTLQAQRIDPSNDSTTHVVLSRDGDNWRFGKLFVEGESAGYEFVK